MAAPFVAIDLAISPAPAATPLIVFLRGVRDLLDLPEEDIAKVKADLWNLPDGFPVFVGDSTYGVRSLNYELLQRILEPRMLATFEAMLGDVSTGTKHVFPRPTAPQSGPESTIEHVLPGNPSGNNRGNFSVTSLLPADFDIKSMLLPSVIALAVVGHSDPSRPLSEPNASALATSVVKFVARRAGTLEQCDGSARMQQFWVCLACPNPSPCPTPTHPGAEMNLCTYASMHLCTCAPMHLCTYAPVHPCTCAPMHLCTYAPHPQERLMVLIAESWPKVPPTQKKGAEKGTFVQLPALVYWRLRLNVKMQNFRQAAKKV